MGVVTSIVVFAVGMIVISGVIMGVFAYLAKKMPIDDEYADRPEDQNVPRDDRINPR